MTREEFDNLELYDHIETKNGNLWWVCEILPSGVILQNVDKYTDMFKITTGEDLSEYKIIEINE